MVYIEIVRGCRHGTVLHLLVDRFETNAVSYDVKPAYQVRSMLSDLAIRHVKCCCDNPFGELCNDSTDKWTWQPMLPRAMEKKTSLNKSETRCVGVILINSLLRLRKVLCLHNAFICAWHRTSTNQPVDSQPAWPEYFWPYLRTVRRCQARCRAGRVTSPLPPA